MELYSGSHYFLSEPSNCLANCMERSTPKCAYIPTAPGCLLGRLWEGKSGVFGKGRLVVGDLLPGNI